SIVLSAAAVANAFDCLQITRVQEAMECCRSMACSPPHHQAMDCCQDMATHGVAFMALVAKTSFSINHHPVTITTAFQADREQSSHGCYLTHRCRVPLSTASTSPPLRI